MGKMKSVSLMMAMAAMMSEYDNPYSKKSRSVELNGDVRHIEPIPPRGTKEYFFNIDGYFSTESMKKDECVFKCFAINEKNALRKFNKWERCIKE